MSADAKQAPSPPCKHWQMVQVGDLCDAVNGRAFKSSEWRTSGVPIIRIENLKDSSAKHNYFEGHLDERHRVRRGDLLFAWSGTPGTSFGAHIWQGVDAALNQHIFNLRFDAAKVDARYLLHALNQQVTEYVRKAQGGVGLAHITKSKFTASWLPVAPLPEQRDIVAAIESHFSRLDAATATLERVQRNLERYRASVLKAAVEGRLVPTEAELAKKEGRSYEPASVLLKRILAERRRRWEEAELAKLKAKGKPPTDDRWKAKYEEPAAPDTDGLPGLPEGWCWATADQLAWSIRNGCSIAPREKDGVRILRISAVRPLACDLNDVRFLPGPVGNYEEFLVQPGDLLFTRYNGTRSLVGVCALVQHLPAPTVHPDKLIRVQLLPGCDAGFVELATNVGASRKHVESRTRTTAGQAGVSGADIKSLPVPLPPAAEQARIREASDELLTVASSVSATVLASLARSARTRQSILKWAFEGRLSDQHRGTTPAPTAVDNPATMRRSASTEPSARR